ncbi:MAG: 30S ribosomal protein S2 [Candidatus Nealsonbacteria bacterium]|nr:30S ribosomal protein S2 [Candidatus Nealsonbacteria bacterium]
MTKKEKKSEIKISAEEMAQAGLHFGHKTSKINPKMNSYLAGTRNSISIIDLEKTTEKLKEALDFIQDIVSEGKILLLVGTKVQVKELLKNTAEECGLPYVSERWLGGTFTNFETIKKRIDYFKDLENKRNSGELEKYTKKEKAIFDREIKGLQMRFGGIKSLTRVPDAIFISDMKKEILAIREAKAKGVKVIGIADTNVDPNLADYPIPANDDAITSLRYILEKVKEAILNAKPKEIAK